MLNRTTRVAASSRTLAMPWQSMLIKLGFVEMVASALLISSLLSGCSGGCSREQTQTPPEESVVKRMEDPVYRSQLESLRAEQNEIAARADAIAKELDAARAEDPESAKTKELEKKHAAVLVEMEALRAKALVAVRNRMLQDEADAKAGNKKGK